MSVIRESIRDKHTISNFVFRDLDDENSGDDFVEDGFQPLPIKTVTEPKTYGTNTQSSSVENQEDLEKRDGRINSLLEKSDALSDELMKVQRKLTNQESLFRDEMQNSKENAYKQGVQDGLLQAKTDVEEKYSSSIVQLQDSINKLEELSSQVSSMLNSVEKELVHTSVAIAKEVVDSEISFNSGQVAINLAKSLMQRLDEAKEIQIRVNLNDYESVKVGLSNLNHIEIIPDNAVAKGGVILISNVGSIEGNIMERYKKIKSDSIAKIDG